MNRWLLSRLPAPQPATRRPRLALTPLEGRAVPATHTWTNAGATHNWSEAANWSGGAPTSNEAGGTIVVIPVNDPLMVQNIAGLTIAKLQFTNAGATTVTLAAPLAVDCNVFTDNVVNTSGTNTITGGTLTLTNAQCDIPVNGSSHLTIESQVAGTQSVYKVGTGTLTVAGSAPNTYTGSTTVADGVLELNNSATNVAVSNTLVVGDGSGGGTSAVLRLLQGGEIPDAAAVTVKSDGLFDLNGFSDAVGPLALDGGSLVTSGTGTLFLGGDVTRTGTPSSAAAVVSGRLNLGGAARTFTVADAAAATDLLITAVISGSGGLVKAGAGTLEFAGTAANTYTGTTAVTDGVLALNNDLSNVAVSSTLVVGDGAGPSQSAVVRLRQDSEIPDAAAVAIHSDGILDLFAHFDTVGALTLDQGANVATQAGVVTLTGDVTVTAVGAGGPALFTGNLALGAAPRTFTVADGPAAPDLEIVAVVTGANGLVKAGPGSMILDVANPYTGATVVNAGLLVIDGVQGGGPVTLDGGTVGGDGVVGAFTAAGGTVAPSTGGGSTPLIFNTGNLLLGPATYAPLVSAPPGGAADKLNVVGTVNLTGSTLAPTRVGAALPAGTKLVILANDGADPVVGTFAGLPEGALLTVNGQVFAVSYAGGDGNDVTLTASTQNPPTISDVPDQATNAGTPVGPVPFVVADAETPPAMLTVTAASSNPALVPAGAVTFGGSGANRTVTVAPAAGQSGASTITLTVTDGSGLTATDTFTVTVPPPGSPPVTPPPVVPRPVLVGAPQYAVGSDAGTGGTATLYNADKSVRFAVTPFAGFAGGVRTAAADFNGDGVADLVAGSGPGSASHVIIYDGANQSVLFTLDPFEAGFTGGVYVAAGDLNGDGKADLAITPDQGGGPRVRVFSGAGFGQLADFFGIDDPAFRGGARAAVGDINGDGAGDLVVSAGFTGGPRVAAFSGPTLGAAAPVKLFGDFFAFEPSLVNGAYVAAGDLDGDGKAELIAGGGPGGGPRVTAFSGAGLLGGTQTRLADFFAGDVTNRGGVRVAVKNLDGDARGDLVVGAGSGAGSRVTAYAGKTINGGGTPPELYAFDAVGGFTGGVFVG